MKVASKTIDNLGRVIIPDDFLLKNGFLAADEVQVFLYNKEIYVCKDIDDIQDIDFNFEKTLFQDDRKIDSLNRICIPIKIRRRLNLQHKSSVNVIQCNNYLKIIKNNV